MDADINVGSMENLSNSMTEGEASAVSFQQLMDADINVGSMENLSNSMTEGEASAVSFQQLGLIEVLCSACKRLGWTSPTAIQQKAIPLALNQQDVIGLAETGSGKTGAFALPILQALIAAPQKLFALILTPTRELAYQIKEQFEALGKVIGVKCSVIVGGMDMKKQTEELRERPHIIIGTPGRLLDHLKKTKGFNLRDIKYLVMDEADRILNMDFEEEVNSIINELPSGIRTFMFSATMTSKVNKLQRVHLRNPVRVEVSTKYQTVSQLKQFMLFVPHNYKPVYLVYLLNEIGEDKSVIIFCMTRTFTMRTTLLLRSLGFNALPLFGKMDQNKRLGVLNKFKSKDRSILLATDVASRGLDIPDVDYVLNYDCPTNPKDYIHRVGRTARAGKEGTAITLVDQYTVFSYTRVEYYLRSKLPVYPVAEDEVMVFRETVMKSVEIAEKELTKLNYKGEKRKRSKISLETPLKKHSIKKGKNKSLKT